MSDENWKCNQLNKNRKICKKPANYHKGFINGKDQFYCDEHWCEEMKIPYKNKKGKNESS